MSTEINKFNTNKKREKKKKENNIAKIDVEKHNVGLQAKLVKKRSPTSGSVMSWSLC